jgi:hypothetical protein
MILRDPAVDLALPHAFIALALVAALDFARAGWPNAVALCLAGLVGGFIWVRTVLLRLAPHRAGGEDG